MKLDIALSYKEVNNLVVQDKITVAIDTFRATSTIITALNHNIKAIYPVAKLNKAQQLKQNKSYLLAGERNGEKISGFDFGNSPLSYNKNNFANKNLILTTTNGTKLFSNLKKADKVYISSLLNQKSIAEVLNQQKKDIIFCCAGNNGELALEDFLTAGAIIDKLKFKAGDVLSDKAIAAREIYLAQQDNLSDFLKKTTSAKKLIALGKEKDIDFILANNFKLIPLYKQRANRIEEFSN